VCVKNYIHSQEYWIYFKLKKSFLFQIDMETLQVFIKTEEEEKEDVPMQQTQSPPEKLPYIEPVKSER
jgi:hypothetical protein